MPAPAIERISRLTLVTADPVAASRFFEEAFDFITINHRICGEAEAQLVGCPNARISETVMRLGDQEIALQAFDPPGQPYPSGSTSTDLWFQHFAIIVSDMASAYDRLCRTGRFVAISEGGLQVLPPSSGSVSAFKFRDSEGHPLELLGFPPGGGPQIWQERRGGGLFLGIDHSAISVDDAERSVEFFKQGFGLKLGERTLNQGVEQSRMDAVPDACVSVTPLQPSQTPPHVELLGYHVGSRRPIAETTASNDIAATHFVMDTDDLASVAEALTAQGARFISPGIVRLTDGSEAIMVLDPDGHRFVVRQAKV